MSYPTITIKTINPNWFTLTDNSSKIYQLLANAPSPIGPLEFNLLVLDKSYSQQPHTHTIEEISIPISGTFCLETEDGLFTPQANDILYHPANRLHRIAQHHTQETSCIFSIRIAEQKSHQEQNSLGFEQFSWHEATEGGLTIPLATGTLHTRWINRIDTKDISAVQASNTFKILLLLQGEFKILGRAVAAPAFVYCPTGFPLTIETMPSTSHQWLELSYQAAD